MRTEAEREAAATGMTVLTKRDKVRAAQGRAIARALQTRGWTQADLWRATKIPATQFPAPCEALTCSALN